MKYPGQEGDLAGALPSGGGRTIDTGSVITDEAVSDAEAVMGGQPAERPGTGGPEMTAEVAAHVPADMTVDVTDLLDVIAAVGGEMRGRERGGGGGGGGESDGAKRGAGNGDCDQRFSHGGNSS
jgi:hypothetical protein